MNFAINNSGTIKDFGPKKEAKAEASKPAEKPAKKAKAKAKKEDSE